jgi:hypothetical protein
LTQKEYWRPKRRKSGGSDANSESKSEFNDESAMHR